MRLTNGWKSALPSPPGSTTRRPYPSLGAVPALGGSIRKYRLWLSLPARRSRETTSATSSCAVSQWPVTSKAPAEATTRNRTRAPMRRPPVVRRLLIRMVPCWFARPAAASASAACARLVLVAPLQPFQGRRGFFRDPPAGGVLLQRFEQLARFGRAGSFQSTDRPHVTQLPGREPIVDACQQLLQPRLRLRRRSRGKRVAHHLFDGLPELCQFLRRLFARRKRVSVEFGDQLLDLLCARAF